MAKTFLTKKNNAKSTITDNPLLVGATTLNVQTGDGAKFPAAPFHATLYSGDPATGEIVKVTAKSTDAFTITRAQEGTSAAQWAQNTKLELLVTAKLFDDFQTRTELVVAQDGSGDYNCDGVDDHTEIAEAIAALPAGGGILRIKKGTYQIGASLQLLNNNCIIEGEGAATIFQMKAATNLDYQLSIGNGGTTTYGNNLVRNIQFDGNKANQTSGAGSGVIVYGATGYLNHKNIITNCWVHDSRFDGIRLLGSTDCTVEGNVVWNCSGTAIGVFTSTVACSVVGNLAYSNGYGYYDNASIYNVVTGNVFRNNGYGCYISGASRMVISANNFNTHTNYDIYLIAAIRCTITGNFCYGSSCGIVVGNSASATRNNVIIGNSIAWTTNYGIALYYGSGGTHYNTVSGNTFYGTGLSAIYMYATSYNVISDNVIDYASRTTNNSSDSISVHYNGANYSTYNVIANNNIQASQANKARYHIYETSSGCDYNMIEGNVLSGAATANLLVSGAHTVYADTMYDMFMDVIAEGTATVHAAIAGTGVLQNITTAITNPDVPRNVSITTTNVAAPSGNVVITGLNTHGRSVTDTIAIAAGATVAGVVAFSTVTNIQIPAGVSASDTVSVGMGTKLGLSNFIRLTGDVFKEKKNTADATIGTVNVANSTVDVGAITAGDDFTLYYLNHLNVC